MSRFIPRKVFLILLVLNIFLLGSFVQAKCTDRPECFKKVIFNFNFPQMNLFPIKGTSEQLKEYSVKAYGDFNNDLITDFVALNQSSILVFVWNSDTFLYEKVYNQTAVMQCNPKTIYLYDANEDGRLDFTIWGTKKTQGSDDQNCLIPFIRQTEDLDTYKFNHSIMRTMQPTSDPILIGHKFQKQMDSVGLLLFENKTRKFVRFNHPSNGTPSYIPIQWNKYAKNASEYQALPFKDPHWNTFMDLTGDCLPDLIILNEKKQLEFWIGQGENFNLVNKDIRIQDNLKGYSISDINYDGSGDLVLLYEKFIRIYLNTKKLQPESQFCCQQCKQFPLNHQPIDIYVPHDKTIKQQGLHFGDIDIDGYPDLLLILIDSDKKQTPVLYQNLFQTEDTFSPFTYPNFNEVLSSNGKDNQILSVSFIDILQNGILDIIVSSKVGEGKVQTQMFYNNYLYQNNYYIKGYGLMGPGIQNGSQYPAMSFYWVNSVNNDFKVTYQAQMIQTSYDALHMPYTFGGLGRANNYVESFTVGRNGEKQLWSPIIPNSQLGVFTMNDDPENWKIKIFSFPIYELIAVIIVTSTILVIFGVFLMYKKCKTYGKKEEHLEIQFIS